MIPLTLTGDLQETLLDYLTTTFNLQDRALEAALEEFLQQGDGGGMFQGPYLQLRLPFRKAAEAALLQEVLDIAPSFTPYVHQVRAWERLSSKDGRSPEGTIITTGTGSGKTECFLYPILDHCFRHAGEPGIKAIILYPMNALATDQAKRLAGMIYNDERLRGAVTAGLYVGGESATPRTAMGPDFVIDERATMRERAPDILLTNYRMLDFLLMRPGDKQLWAGNGPQTLRYLVLDELHTYDGAQGSDVASLIRRLKARLQIPEGALVPVGTSATVVSPSGDTNEALVGFAEEIFGTALDTDAVIGEERIGQSEFLAQTTRYFDLPADMNSLREKTGESLQSYLSGQMRAWFSEVFEPAALGAALREHQFLGALLEVMGDGVLDVDMILRRLARRDPALAALAVEEQRLVLQSFLAMTSYARVYEGGREMPFLTVQAQIWVREMSRLMRKVTAEAGFFWRDDVPLGSPPKGLPAYVCRECGHSGWLAVQREGDEALTEDTRQIYDSSLKRSKNLVYVYPLEVRPASGPAGGEERLFEDRLCTSCLHLGTSEECVACGGETIAVARHHEVSQAREGRRSRDLQRCPICRADNSLGILGRRAASLLSVAISHLFTSPLNMDNKLLAFTDSVQDASHRAAFFGARTYRFGLRTAIQEAGQVAGASGPVSPASGAAGRRLSDLTDHMMAFWAERWQGELPVDDAQKAEQRLVAAFMPPDLNELASYRRYVDGPAKPLPQDLDRALRQRLSWEVIKEYGFDARIGRSLEKVGSSKAAVDGQMLAEVVARLALILREESGLLRDLSGEAVSHFLRGLLERTRTRGGVYHPLLARYVRDQGNPFLLVNRRQRHPLMQPFGVYSPKPIFLRAGGKGDNFDQVISGMKRPTWFVDWARKTLSADLGVQEINDVYRQALALLVDAGILMAEAQGPSMSYGIRPESLLISHQTASLRCDVCGQQWTVRADSVNDWLGKACMNYQCRGHFGPDTEEANESYYRALYERGQVARIFSEEHTGLLAREDREHIEQGFKTQAWADAPNLLTATPTLEMGIDVGDLSATVACTVPPTTANYLQRIGRAGRATGNSLVLTLANVRPHDLYFFEQPLEMIAGAIVPPGAYLDAPNMLKRQYLAFCMDSWTLATAAAGDKLPRNVQRMLAGLKREGFPLDLLAFIEGNKTTLIARFLVMFAEVVSEENKQLLLAYAMGDEVRDSLLAAVEEAQETRARLRKEYRALRREHEKIEKDPALFDEPEEQKAELKREMRIIGTAIKQLEEQYILQFFTDAGLLPNYAFPETGVKLRAIITGFESADGEKNYLAKEYVRSAPAAIRELAPFNTFYAEGRKVVVNSLDLQGDDAHIETWQFCDRCVTMAQVAGTHYSAVCPNCGSGMWADQGQQHGMVRLREVSARNDVQSSRAGDDGDERERAYYHVGQYFDLDPQYSQGAYYIQSLPFGIEALRQVTLREINFGLRDTYGNRMLVAGEEQPEAGFLVCPGCGVVQDPRERDNPAKTQHGRMCRYRDREAEVAWQELFLYREMTSEALRILLPVSTVFVSEKLATFQAALDLGLRRIFQGDPDHLQIGSAVEVTAEGHERRYLMIYDTVPGGTSYLRDLAKPEKFRELLEAALEILTSCHCQFEEGKVACYRCLYSYKTQYDKEFISRQLGVELLQEVLAAWNTIEGIDSLSGVEMERRLESELELKFVLALKELAEKRRGWGWQARPFKGKEAYVLTIEEKRWLIEPQVYLGAAQGVDVASKPDFVFWPQGDLRKKTKPVAVFVDGHAYHVQPQLEMSRVQDDVRKREALLRSGEFHVWTAVWDDVVEFEAEDAFPLAFLNSGQAALLRKMMNNGGREEMARALAENGVSQLLRFLKDPQVQNWEALAAMLGLTLMSPLRPGVSQGTVDAVAQKMREQARRPNLTVADDAPAGDVLYGISEQGDVQLLMHVAKEALQRKDSSEFQVLMRLDDAQDRRNDDVFKQEWRQFWLLANVWQFLRGFEPLSTEQVEMAAAGLPSEETQEVEPQAVLVELDEHGITAWEEAFEYADPAVEDVLKEAMAAGAAVPEVGYELVDERGLVIAMAELAWVDEQTAVFVAGQEGDRELFEEKGWTNAEFGVRNEE